MVKKSFALAALVVLIIGVVGYFAWFTRSRAQSGLSRARTMLNSLESSLHRDNNVEKAASDYILARIEVESLENNRSMWVSGEEVAAIRNALDGYQKEIDERTAGTEP